MSELAGPEVEANMGRARESIEAARSLAGRGFHDFAASRAYYAAFYALTAVLLAEGLPFRKHGGAITSFHRHFVKTERLPESFGRDLRLLYELRLVGDYGETRHVPESEARKAISTAERFVDRLASLLEAGD